MGEVAVLLGFGMRIPGGAPDELTAATDERMAVMIMSSRSMAEQPQLYIRSIGQISERIY